MPNWIEGTMKLRGKKENIRRFFLEGIEPNDLWAEKDRKECIRDCTDEYEIGFEFENEPWITDTTRAFITGDSVYVNLEDGKEDGVACVNIKQAWSFNPRGQEDRRIWQAIAKKYDLDIRLFGIEQGRCFAQEMIYFRDGERTIENHIEYEDWDWECPFPRMGG